MTRDECARIGEACAVEASKQTADLAYNQTKSLIATRVMLGICYLLPDADAEMIEESYHRTRQQIRAEREAEELRFQRLAEG